MRRQRRNTAFWFRFRRDSIYTKAVTMNSSTLKNIVEFVAEGRSGLLLSKTGMVM